MNEYRELLDACDVVFEVAKSPSTEQSDWIVIGYLANASPNEQRPITQRGEIGSNATILLVDEGQRGMSFQRLNVARADSSNVDAPYERNFPALIKWVVKGGVGANEKIIVELDDPAFNTPFDIRKTYYTVDRENTGAEATPVAKIIYRNARIVQLGIGIGASSKYMEDGISISWELTDVEDIGNISAADDVGGEAVKVEGSGQ